MNALKKFGPAVQVEDEKSIKPSTTRATKECGNCGMVHGRDCPAYGRTCFHCGNMNHFAQKCRAQSRGRKPRVSTITSFPDTEEDPYYISSLTEKNKPQARMAVIELQILMADPKSEVQFQIDTGSQCDILPAGIYKQITGDTHLRRLKPCNKEIVSYTREQHRIAGKANFPVSSGGKRNSIEFNIIDGDYQPILSLNTSITLGFVSLHNCDVLALRFKTHEECDDVFEGLGALPGNYKIVVDETVPPVVHAPRRVPVALRPRIKTKLDELVDRKVIVPVTEPTE